MAIRRLQNHKQSNMASDPEKWERFTITVTVWHLHTDVEGVSVNTE